ncbi:hypothetical protein PJW08_11100 [Tenacibaculum finnmarkense]|nr:hypothetical protein PJW08_11100 [Tenacibaculum finnmarkense]
MEILLQVIVGTSASQAVNDNSTISPFSAITTTDADGDNLSATITLDDNAKGVLSGTRFNRYWSL